MKCLMNLGRLNYPSDLVFDLATLYSFKGKDFYYEDVLKSEMDLRVKATIEKDTIYASKLLNLNVTDNRIKLIVKNDSAPRTKEEQVVANLKEVFKIIQAKGTDLKLTDNEFLMLAVKTFDGFKDVRYVNKYVMVQENLLPEKKNVSKRDIMEKMIELYDKAISEQKIEPTQVIVNMYIDCLHEECYDYANEFLSLLVMYCLLVSQRFNVFKYISFFEAYTQRKPEFDTNTVAASYNWENGYSQTSLLNRSLIKLLIDSYTEVDGMTEDKLFDKGIRKIDEVQGVILHFQDDTFTRQDIKKAAPYLSDSTINRALEKLKENGKIEAMGTGRSAKWVRKGDKDMLATRAVQMDIFSIDKQ